MNELSCFPPIINRATRTLILGTMPGQASLEAQQYYAHPRNQFWPMMEALFSIRCSWPYAKRTAELLKAGVGVWDVLQSCVREGSLDSAIKSDSVVVNDFATLLDRCPQLDQIVFNGAMAERLFHRHSAPKLQQRAELEQVKLMPKLTRMPSTSPANASLSFAAKLDQWAIIRPKKPS